MKRMGIFLSQTFAVWMLAVAFWAYRMPEVFRWLAPWISPLLGVVMFAMGLTLRTTDFREIFRRPKVVFLGVLAQYILMPLIAYMLCLMLSLPRELALGVLLVGACPGGTSSNVLTYLARGDVALSVTLTSCTTLLSPIVTPLILSVFASTWIEIDAVAMFWSIVQIVLLPVAAGVVLNTLFEKRIAPMVKALPAISMMTIVLIVAVVVSLSTKVLANAMPIVCLAVLVHNAMGLVLGYIVAALYGMSAAQRACVSIEVGTQNAGLGAALATVHFAATPLVAIPSALFSVWNIVAGTFAAGIFKAISKRQ